MGWLKKYWHSLATIPNISCPILFLGHGCKKMYKKELVRIFGPLKITCKEG